MSQQENPRDRLQRFLPKVHIDGASRSLSDAVRRMEAHDGTENDWRNSITTPRPIEWEENPDLIGSVVVPHTCAAKAHNGSEGCICDCLGKPVIITGLVESSFVGTPTYNILGATPGTVKHIQEREFSEITRGTDPQRVGGFVLEDEQGRVLSAAFVWIPVDNAAANGYIHNHQVTREIVKSGLLDDRTVTAHLASARHDGTERLVGDFMSGQALADLFTPKNPTQSNP